MLAHVQQGICQASTELLTRSRCTSRVRVSIIPFYVIKVYTRFVVHQPIYSWLCIDQPKRLLAGGERCSAPRGHAGRFVAKQDSFPHRSSFVSDTFQERPISSSEAQTLEQDIAGDTQHLQPEVTSSLEAETQALANTDSFRPMSCCILYKAQSSCSIIHPTRWPT